MATDYSECAVHVSDVWMDGGRVARIVEIPVDAARLDCRKVKYNAFDLQQVVVAGRKLTQSWDCAKQMGKLPNTEWEWRAIS